MFKSNFVKFASYFLIFILTIIVFISVSLFQILNYNTAYSNLILNGEFIWPLPNNTHISSFFGKRTSPSAGASSYHSGIDIPAPEGTPILSICSGIVSFASWGAGRWIYYSCTKQ